MSHLGESPSILLCPFLILILFQQDECDFVSSDVPISTQANCAISLDAMGIAGFSHDLGAIHDRRSEIRDGFERLTSLPMSVLDILVVVLQPVFPIVKSIPSARNSVYTQIKDACGQMARQLLNNLAGSEDAVDAKSVLGLLSAFLGRSASGQGSLMYLHGDS
jgi:hypothetical protein